MASLFEKPGELYGRFKAQTMRPGGFGRGVLRTLAWTVPAAARAETRLTEYEARIAKLDATTASVTASVVKALGLPEGTTAHELAAYFEIRSLTNAPKDPIKCVDVPEIPAADCDPSGPAA